MSSGEQEQRAAVCEEARSWLRTPYHHAANVKGAGVDCAMLLCEVYHTAGIVPKIDPRPYPPDWWMHRSEEKFLGFVTNHCVLVETPLPGDIVVYQFGRCFSHGGVVIEWPTNVHAWYRSKGVELALGDNGMLSNRARLFYSPWHGEQA